MKASIAQATMMTSKGRAFDIKPPVRLECTLTGHQGPVYVVKYSSTHTIT